MLNSLLDREQHGRSTKGRETFQMPPMQQSLGFLQRLTLERTLGNQCDVGHHGCVNTVSFTPSGDTLISGSDDLRIIMWNWRTGKQNFVFKPGHQNNIFQAKAIPHSSDRTILSCAADGQVRMSQLGEGGSIERKLITHHRGRAHKLALLPEQPQVFLSCGEDGEVRMFDLRDKGQPTGKVGYQPKMSLTVHGHTRMAADINAVAINPARNHLFAVACSDQFVRVYDLRQVKSPGTGASEGSWKTLSMEDSPVLKFCPNHLANPKRYERCSATSAVYSKCGELLVTYNDEDIYLFDSVSQEARLHAGTKMETSSACESKAVQRKRKASTSKHGADEDGIGNTDKDSDDMESSEDPTPEASRSNGKGPKEPSACVEDHVLQKYTGHRNLRTVKGVNFFGPRDEFVVSGSDCGHIFIWSKEGGELRQMMHGDEDVVNCLEPHPHDPFVLATSGIENDVKIWGPVAESPVPLDIKAVKKVTSGNRRLALPWEMDDLSADGMLALFTRRRFREQLAGIMGGGDEYDLEASDEGEEDEGEEDEDDEDEDEEDEDGEDEVHEYETEDEEGELHDEEGSDAGDEGCIEMTGLPPGLGGGNGTTTTTTAEGDS